ncbi:MAG: hypothetical protein LQ340_001098 [Diploschistes diacapsis]|nr:MAG: hypothetical protein LQ340_001098 [Diploschistes diacapsis]
MLSITLLSLGALGLVAAASDAPITTNNPLGATYMAMLPCSNSTPIRGSVLGTTNSNGSGIDFTVSLDHIPVTGGPYIYHIHQYPVPSTGNCTGTGAHLDPENRGEEPGCDITKPETCQVGDLAGKFPFLPSFLALSSPPTFVRNDLRKHSVSFPTGTSGHVLARKNVTADLHLRYLDLFVSSEPGTPAFFGNRSLVVHDGSGDRIACANFTALQAGVGGGGGGSGANATSTKSATAAKHSTATATETGAGAGTATCHGATAASTEYATAASATSTRHATTTSTTIDTGTAPAAVTPTASLNATAIHPFTGTAAAAKRLSAGAVLLAGLAFFL